jgi:hypothetical protein
MAEYVDYAAVALLGLLVGAGELISRYKDAPKKALYTGPAIFYIALNVAASILALALIRGFNRTFNTTGPSQRWAQVLVAGVSAMAFFRSSLFIVRAGDRDLGIGPGTFLEIFRFAADPAVDRLRARARSQSVAKLMEGIDYHKASAGLVPYCLALMQNVPVEEQTKLYDDLKALGPEPMDDAIKVRVLGLALLNVVGPGVLAAAVDGLRDRISNPPLLP